MTIYSIYKITNQVNNKIYIGFTSKQNPYDRFNGNRNSHLLSSNSKSNFVIHKAIRKYGIDSFIFEVIYQSKDNKHCKNIMEEYFIRLYNSHCVYGYGYNMTYGGEGTVGYKHSEETKAKMSISAKKWKRTDKTRAKMSASHMDMKHSTKSKMKMSKLKLGGKWVNNGFIEKLAYTSNLKHLLSQGFKYGRILHK